jgi:hypothetical protein
VHVFLFFFLNKLMSKNKSNKQSQREPNSLGIPLANMACFLLCLVSALGVTIKPWFSWDTVMPFIHFANSSGPFSDEAIAIMATFPMCVSTVARGVL